MCKFYVIQVRNMEGTLIFVDQFGPGSEHHVPLADVCTCDLEGSHEMQEAFASVLLSATLQIPPYGLMTVAELG